MWNLEGQVVVGTYLDEHPVRGTVRHSRMRNAGDVYHYVELHHILYAYGSYRSVVVLDERDISEVLGCEGDLEDHFEYKMENCA